MAKNTLPPEVAARVEQRLNQVDWEAKYPHPHTAQRMTAYREAKTKITALVLLEEETKQAREAAKAAKAAQADLARWGAGGGQR